MTTSHSAADSLSEVRELNRLFLSFLRGRLASRGEHLGLPGAAAAALARSSDDLICRLAEFPQAMFRLDFDALGRQQVMDPTGGEVDASLGALQLMLLLSMRNLSRASSYGARLYLRLSGPQQKILCDLAITEVPVISYRRDIVRCAYPQLAWMWAELLRNKQPGQTRALVLLALQPRIEINPPLPLSG